jgi:hypothetical protein
VRGEAYSLVDKLTSLSRLEAVGLRSKLFLLIGAVFTACSAASAMMRWSVSFTSLPFASWSLSFIALEKVGLRSMLSRRMAAVPVEPECVEWLSDWSWWGRGKGVK